MKLMFRLAIISKEGQDISDLLKPYLKILSNESLERSIKKQKRFISGVIFGNIDEDYANNEILIVKKENKKYLYESCGKIKDVCWSQMAIRETEKENKKIKLEENFCISHSLITPDGKWHGMIPLDLITCGFRNKEESNKYIKDYYTQYIKPYENNGIITIVTCNI